MEFCQARESKRMPGCSESIPKDLLSLRSQQLLRLLCVTFPVWILEIQLHFPEPPFRLVNHAVVGPFIYFLSS